MNFFKLYIGDYLRDTGDLSPGQHGIYLLMLMKFYATETPLPIGEPLYRLLSLQTENERADADRIAARFFETTERGLISNRAVRELGAAVRQAEINRQTGKRGGRPRSNARETESVTESVIESVTEPKPNREPNRNPNHSHSHTPEDQEQEHGARKRSPAFVPPTVEQVREHCQSKGYRVDAEAFVAHYTANGWKVGGRAPMRDWRSATVTWHKRDLERRTPNGADRPSPAALRPL